MRVTDYYDRRIRSVVQDDGGNPRWMCPARKAEWSKKSFYMGLQGGMLALVPRGVDYALYSLSDVAWRWEAEAGSRDIR